MIELCLFVVLDGERGCLPPSRVAWCSVLPVSDIRLPECFLVAQEWRTALGTNIFPQMELCGIVATAEAITRLN